jgi:Neuraminidase (sialidase)
MNVNDNVIRQVVTTCDATSFISRIYVNGVLDATGIGNAAPIDPGGIFTFSKFGSSSGFYFNGTLYNFKVYNRALSAAEIKQNFEATRDRYGI